MSHFIELSRRISGDVWYEIWSGMPVSGKQLSEEVQYQSRGWTDIWLLRFIEGMVIGEESGVLQGFLQRPM